VKGVLQALLDGVTLGTLMQDPQHPMTGYVALAAVLLFLLGVFLLPARAQTGLVRRSGGMGLKRG
jgi:hypothetical protein